MEVIKAENDRGIPLGFLSGFVEAVLNESVKDRIETAVDEYTANSRQREVISEKLSPSSQGVLFRLLKTRSGQL
jgi:hypothetical protein